MRRVRSFGGIVATILVLTCVGTSAAQSNLQVTYGSHGIQTLSYQGVALEDLSKNPLDAFHIWHMKMTDQSGKVAPCRQCGWGENNNGRSWDAATHTWTYVFSWGTI